MPYSAVLIAAAFSLCLHWDRSSVLAIQATEATLSTDSVPKESSGTAASSAVKREVAAAVRWDVAAEEPSSGTFTKHSDDTVVESKPSILVENDDGEATSLPSLLTSPSIKNVPERPPPTKRKGSATTVTGNRSGAAANPPRTSTAASATKYRGAEGDNAGYLLSSDEERTATAAAFVSVESRQVAEYLDEVEGWRRPPSTIIGSTEQRRGAGEVTTAASATEMAAETESRSDAAGSAGSAAGDIGTKRLPQIDVGTDAERKGEEKEDREERKPAWLLLRGGAGSDSRRGGNTDGTGIAAAANSAAHDASMVKAPTITATTTAHVSDGQPRAQEPQQHLQKQRRQRQRQLQERQRRLAMLNETSENNQPGLHVSPDGEGSGGLMPFQLDGMTPAFMSADGARNYLNDLVDKSVAAVNNQTYNIAFVKTHKTASTTFATILYRYGKRHDIDVANFKDRHSAVDLPEAAKEIQESGQPVDMMHYHYSWDGYYTGTWDEAETAYKTIMKDPSTMNLVSVFRDPVSHYLSYYYYYLEPHRGLSITEYLGLAGDVKNFKPLNEIARKKLQWHGEKLFQNPLCAEFGIRNRAQLRKFIQEGLPHFSMVLLTERFEESLAVFMRKFNWDPIDMTYCRALETRAGSMRFDGKNLKDVPKPSDLPEKVLAKIRDLTSMDLVLYKAAVRMYRKHKKQHGWNLEKDVASIRQAQSLVHGFLDFVPDSDAHQWYEGNVKCFDNPSPLRHF